MLEDRLIAAWAEAREHERTDPRAALAAASAGLTLVTSLADEERARWATAEADLRQSQGDALFALRQMQRALSAYDELIARFDASEDVEVIPLVAAGWSARGHAWAWYRTRREEAIAAFRGTAERYAEATDPWVRRLVPFALAHAGAQLVALGRLEEAHTSFDEALCALRATPPARGLMALELAILRVQASVLLRTGRGREVAGLADPLVARLAGPGTPAAARRLAAAEEHQAAFRFFARTHRVTGPVLRRLGFLPIAPG